MVGPKGGYKARTLEKARSRQDAAAADAENDFLPRSVLCATNPAWKVLGGAPWLLEMSRPSVCQGRERKPWSVAESPLALLRN